MALLWQSRASTFDSVPLCELKAEIAPTDVSAVDEILLERSLGNWSVIEDVIAHRAWLAAICPDRGQADADWQSLSGALHAAGISPLAEPAYRMIEDAEWRDSYKEHFHA